MTQKTADVFVQGPPLQAARPTFDGLYEHYFKFVFRSLRRLGVREAQLDDATQDAFLVVHRKLPDYEPRFTPRAWLFAIARRVAHDYRRTEMRKGGGLPLGDAHASQRPGPYEETVKSEASDIILRFLESLPDAQREVFILGELEQLSAPEMSAALGANVSTIYSRVQAARSALERYVRRHHPDLGSGGSRD